MAKSLLIDKLIDDECLTPQQEKFVRSLIKIKLLKPDPNNVIVFEVTVLKNSSRKIYTLKNKHQWRHIKKDFYRKVIVSLLYANELMSKSQQGLRNKELFINQKIGLTTFSSSKDAKESVYYSVPMGGNLTYSIFICSAELKIIKLNHLYRLLLESHGK